MPAVDLASLVITLSYGLISGSVALAGAAAVGFAGDVAFSSVGGSWAYAVQDASPINRISLVVKTVLPGRLPNQIKIAQTTDEGK